MIFSRSASHFWDWILYFSIHRHHRHRRRGHHSCDLQLATSDELSNIQTDESESNPRVLSTFTIRRMFILLSVYVIHFWKFVALSTPNWTKKNSTWCGREAKWAKYEIAREIKMFFPTNSTTPNPCFSGTHDTECDALKREFIAFIFKVRFFFSVCPQLFFISASEIPSNDRARLD